MLDAFDKDYPSILDMPLWLIGLLVIFVLAMTAGQWFLSRRNPAWLGLVMPVIWIVFSVTGWLRQGSSAIPVAGSLAFLAFQLMVWHSGSDARRGRGASADGTA